MKKMLLLLAPLLLVGCFNSSREVKLIPFAQKDKYGYFDREGKITINPQFAEATAFRDGLALVKTTGDNGKWGYIDEDGKFVINASYKNATVFQDGLAWVVQENGAPSAINKDGTVKFTLKEAEKVRLFSEGLAAMAKADSTAFIWGFVDKSGKEVINTQFTGTGDFSDGKCAVKNKEGKWGYIDKDGKIVINYQFDEAMEFRDGKAVVYTEDKAGVIDADGKYIINPQFQYAVADGDDYLIYQDDKAGWCDKDGKFTINPQFEEAGIFGDSKLASMKSSDKYGYIDKEGKIAINAQFDEASQFMGDIAIVKAGDKYGLIDKEGKYTVNPQFDKIGPDLYLYMAGYSLKSAITTDYLDIDKIISVIDVTDPENLNFEDTFDTVLEKTKKNAADFGAYSDTNLIFEKKTINSHAKYGFAVMGNLKDYDEETREYFVTDEKPQGFLYGIALSGRASGKAETIQKAFEKKLGSYNLMKKGYMGGHYTSVYKNSNSIIITSSEGIDSVWIYILKKDFDIAYYLDKITDKPGEQDTEEVTETEAPAEEYYEYSDSIAAPAVDSVASY
jgi:WG containing repeat